MRLLTSFFALAVTTQTVLAGVLTNLESRCFGPLTGYIRVYNTFKPNTTETRYLSKSTDTASRQKYQGAVYYTTDKSQAALVSIDQCTQPFFVQCTNCAYGVQYSMIGVVDSVSASDIAANSQGWGLMSFVSRTVSGARPQQIPSAALPAGNGWVESTIWYYDATTSRLTMKWMVPQSLGSTPVSVYVQDSALGFQASTYRPHDHGTQPAYDLEVFFTFEYI